MSLRDDSLLRPSGGPSRSFVLRAATKDDLDDITRIVELSFVEEPEQNYRFPYRKQYPDDYRKWTRREYEGYLKHPKKLAFFLVEAPSGSDGAASMRPIALAVWDIAAQIEGSIDIGIDQRKDANKKHCEAFAEAVKQRPKEYFADLGEKHIYLSILMTHPDFRRRGAGTMLTDWGIKNAHEKGWPVTVCASPTGRLLYAHLGFKVIATEVVQVQGEDEVLRTTIMILKTDGSKPAG